MKIVYHVDRPLGVHSPKIQFSVMQPRVVILVPYWKVAQEIYDECCKLVGNRHGNKESVLVIYGGGYEETQEVRCVAEILVVFLCHSIHHILFCKFYTVGSLFMARSHCPTPTQTLRPTNCNSTQWHSFVGAHLHTILYNPFFIGVCIGLCVRHHNSTLPLK